MVTTDYTISHEKRMEEAFDNRYKGTMSRYHSILNMKRRYEEIIKTKPMDNEINPAIHYAIEELGLENISVSLSMPEEEEGRIRICFYYYAAQFRTESDIHYIQSLPEWINFIQDIESQVFMDECMSRDKYRAAKSHELRKALSRIVDALYDYFDNNCEHRRN